MRRLQNKPYGGRAFSEGGAHPDSWGGGFKHRPYGLSMVLPPFRAGPSHLCRGTCWPFPPSGLPKPSPHPPSSQASSSWWGRAAKNSGGDAGLVTELGV